MIVLVHEEFIFRRFPGFEGDEALLGEVFVFGHFISAEVAGVLDEVVLEKFRPGDGEVVGLLYYVCDAGFSQFFIAAASEKGGI